MGWNTIERADDGGVLASVRDGSRFYFVHSYFADPLDPDHRMGLSVHGVAFASMVRRENVAGVQFHPEKSHRAGLALMSDFGRQP
jgi:glutamine amidotransferase